MSQDDTYPDDLPAEDAALAARLPAALKLPEVPPHLHRAALMAFEQRQPSLAERLQAGVRRVLGVLNFDSWAVTPAAAGVRGHAAARQLMYACDGRDIDLRVQPAPGGLRRWRLQGQVLGQDEAGRVVLHGPTDGGPALVEAELDDLGSFDLGTVEAGCYRLSLRFDALMIDLPPFEVGPEAG